ncbi:MAG TPA: hypothetical protein VGP72_15600 [Planctomycetota bacterium]|jgi:hypothetical protein
MNSDNINTPKLAFIGVFTSVLIFVVILASQAFFYHFEAGLTDQKLGNEAPTQRREIESQENGLLHTYRWIDQKKHTVAIPIDRAIDLIAQEKAKGGGI